MKMVSKTPQQIDKSHMWVVAIAQDSGKYYGAIVDPNTLKCYVEEMGVGVSKEDVKGYFLHIYNDQEWRAAMDFFEKNHVFSQFLEGRNMIWEKKDGQLTENAEKLRKKIST